jgi:predicted CoA-binding protein
MNEPQVIRGILAGKTIAVIGLSDDPGKASHYVSAFMQGKGYRILPVNPVLAGQTVLGETVYSSLGELPVVPDVVNVFRLPKFIPAIVDEMIGLGWKQIWVQQGLIHAEAAARAEAAGMRVVMDRCIMVESRM